MELIGFGEIDFETFGWWCGVEEIPPATLVHQTISRPSATAVFGVPTVEPRRIPVEFGTNAPLNSAGALQQAKDQLIRLLKPLDPTPRQLRALRNDGVTVAIDAVLELNASFAGGDVNTFLATFITLDTEWIALTDAVQTKTLGSRMDQAFLIDASAVSRNPPKYRLRPTTQRTGAGAGYGARYRKFATLTNNGTEALANTPVLLPIGDTAALVAASKVLASGDDFRVLVDGREVPRTLKSFNTASSSAWVLVPNLAPGASIQFELIYGNSTMGTPPTLAGANLPAFDLAASTNGSLVYRSDDVAANAGKGMWVVTGSPPTDWDHGVPGAWKPVKTKANNDDSTQRDYTEYVDGGTFYRGVFDAVRSRRGGLPGLANNRQADGVSLHWPLPVTQINVGFSYRNDRRAKAGSPPVGRLVILTKNTGTGQWTIHTAYPSEQTTTFANIAAQNYSFGAGVKDVALAVWPANDTAILLSATAGRRVAALANTDLTVTVDAAGLGFSLGSEEEIYELAGRLIVYEDGSERASRQMVLGAESGGRLTVALGNTLVIDAAARTVEEWNSTATARVRLTPVTAWAARQWVIPDNEDDWQERASEEWPQIVAYANPLPNPNFVSNLTGWSRGTVDSGITAAAPAYDAAIFTGTPGSLRSQITASTAGAGARLWELADTLRPVNGRYLVTVSADARVSTTDVSPVLGVIFRNDLGAIIDTVTSDPYQPIAATTWHRRILAAEVPEGAATWQIALITEQRLANTGGTVWWDNVTPNGPDLVWLPRADDLAGSLELSFASRNAYP